MIEYSGKADNQIQTQDINKWKKPISNNGRTWAYSDSLWSNKTLALAISKSAK